MTPDQFTNLLSLLAAGFGVGIFALGYYRNNTMTPDQFTNLMSLLAGGFGVGIFALGYLAGCTLW